MVVVVVAAGMLVPGESSGAVLWQLPVRFTEFRGQPGGFEPGGGAVVLQEGTGQSVRQYDILQPGTVANTMVRGQDGVTDLSIRSQVVDNSGGRWETAQLERRNNQFRAHVTTDAGTSRSGDSVLMAYEISFSSSLTITADQLSVSLANINGRGELYEWAFVTVGGIDDAPFDPAQVAAYTARDYSAVPSGVTPGTGTGTFENGRPISSFLSGDTRTAPANGLVEPGWWAAENFNVEVGAGAEAARNPRPAPGASARSATVTGSALGLDADSVVQRLTVWFGFHDVGFDTNGDGFTRSAGNQFSGLASLTVGASQSETIPVPEPGLPLLLAFSVAVILGRSRFRRLPPRAPLR